MHFPDRYGISIPSELLQLKNQFLSLEKQDENTIREYLDGVAKVWADPQVRKAALERGDASVQQMAKDESFPRDGRHRVSCTHVGDR